MDVLNCGNFSFSKNQSLVVLHLHVCITLFAKTFDAMAKVQSKYNMIIFKSKTF